VALEFRVSVYLMIDYGLRLGLGLGLVLELWLGLVIAAFSVLLGI